jgi:parallel beta-helix repeat protein
MSMQQKSFLAVAMAAALLLPAVAMAQVRPIGQSDTIDKPGSYVLNQEVRLNGSRPVGIKIVASGVKLDLNGYEIMGPGGKFGTGVMVDGVQGVEVTNGSLSNLAFGVVVHNSRNVKVNNLRIRGMGLPIVELPPETGVMVYQSRNVVVEHNSIYNTGLGIFVRGGQSWGNRIADNTITAGTNPALGICYNPTESDPMAPRGDLVENNVITGFGIGIQMKEMAVSNIIRNNSIAYGEMALDLRNDMNVAENNQSVQLP